jgi:putative membrane protein
MVPSTRSPPSSARRATRGTGAQGHELIEWGAAVAFGGGLVRRLPRHAGRRVDAHKDMALASLGALIAMLATAGLNAGLQRDFAREWVAGLRVGGVLPGAKA